MSKRSDQVKKREELRGYLRTGIMDAIESGNTEEAEKFNSMLNEPSLKKRAFDELSTYTEYTDALKWNVENSTGEAYTGDIKDLIEDDFEHWNLSTNNITAGAINIGDIAMNMSPEEKKNNLLRYTIFDDTDAFGEGSRSFWEQTKDVVGAVMTDPVTYTLAGNVPKIAAKAGQSALIKKMFGEGAEAIASASIVSGAGSALNDLNTQGQRQALGGETIDPVQVGVAGAFGSVAPVVGKYAGQAIGKVARPMTAPIEAIKATGARLLSTKGNKAKMATQEAYNIGESALTSQAKKEAREQAERIKKGFSPSDFSKSQADPKNIKTELAIGLIKDKNYVNDIIRSPAQLKLLQEYFPESIQNIKNIEKLMKGLMNTKGVDEKKIGENFIKSILADTATGVPGTHKVVGIIKGKINEKFNPAKVMEDGTKQSYFINGLLNAYKKRGGRLNTIFGQHIKKKYNLTDSQLAEFQDYTWGLMANMPAQAFYRERHKDFKEKGNNFSY